MTKCTLQESLQQYDLDEHSARYAVLSDAMARVNELKWNWHPLRHPLSVQYGVQETEGSRLVTQKWRVLPRDVSVLVSRVTSPQVFLEPEVDINPETREVMGARMVRIQKEVWADMAMNLSEHSWIYLAWEVDVRDDRNLFPDTVYQRQGQVVTVNATMLELWYCLAPEDFIIHENAIAEARLWHFLRGKEEGFRHAVSILWEKWIGLEARGRTDYATCRAAQGAFNSLCMEALGKKLYLSPIEYFYRNVGDLVEGKAYWGREFWGDRLTSPMQFQVRAALEPVFHEGRAVALKSFYGAPAEALEAATYSDPEKMFVYQDEAMWDLWPGGEYLFEGALTVFFRTEEGTYYGKLKEFCEAIGTELPMGFDDTDPWADKPVGIERKRLWDLVVKAANIMQQFAGYSGRGFNLAKPLKVKFHQHGGFVTIPAGARIEILPAPSTDPDVGFSRELQYVDDPIRPYMDYDQLSWPMEKQLFAGLYKYRSVGWDVRDEDGLVGAVRLLSIARRISPGSIPKVKK